MTRRVWLSLLFLCCAHCSWCAAPKPSPDEDLSDRDAAPHTEAVRPRCQEQSKIALPVSTGQTFELGRVARTLGHVLIGARRGARAGVVDTDGLTARFTEVADSIGDVPPPLPLVDGERTITIEYEGGRDRHLVLRDLATPALALAELPPDPHDESLAYDAAPFASGIAVAWDAPAGDGSAIYASIVTNGKVGDAVRLSPDGVDADTPRLVALGPTLVAMWIAHRALPKTDAAVALEGAGQDLDRTWIELLAFDATLHATSPLRHLTPDTGRIATFDAVGEVGGSPTITVIARDALELQAGQGGSAVVVRARGPEVDAPTVVADHVGRGTPLYMTETVLFDDPSDRGCMVVHGVRSPEPVLDSARPLAVLSSGDVLVASEAGTELHVIRCQP